MTRDFPLIKRVGWFVSVFSAITFGASVLAVAGDYSRGGIHFQVYGEPHEVEKPIYVNVLPLTYERALASHITLKFGTILSLRFADKVSLGNIGAKLGFLAYLSSNEESRLEGLFAGPLMQVSRNLHTSEVVISSAVDLGYSFYLGERMSMSLGVEAGISTFFLDGKVAHRPHFGPGIYLYF